MPKTDTLDAYIDAAAQALGIPIQPEWKPEIRANLDVTFKLAALSAKRSCRTMPSPRRSSRPDPNGHVVGERRGDRRSRDGGRVSAAGHRGRARAHHGARSGAQLVHRRAGGARAQARAGDRRARAAKQPLGPLAGVPFAVKNLFDVKGSRRAPDRRSTASLRPRRMTSR
jgi:hypothetical protein